MQLSAQMLVGSYNIRYKNSGDSINGDLWPKRCQVMCDQVNFMSPDIFGAQEVLHGQLIDMLACLNGYDYIGVGRDDGAAAGEYAAIFYRTDRLRLLDYGNFWLSETPDAPGLGWDAACVRICTWGRFAGQTATDDEAFYFFNTHMDHVGVIARREAAKLIVSKIREIAQGAPVILTGDFNVDQNDEIYVIFTESGFLKDSYLATRQRLPRTARSIPSILTFTPKAASIISSFHLKPTCILMVYSPTAIGSPTLNQATQSKDMMPLNKSISANTHAVCRRIIILSLSVFDSHS